MRVASLLGAVALLALAPPVARAAGPGGVTLVPTLEAWYMPDPACGTPAGCLHDSPAGGVVPAAADPYPVGTLHVGLTGAGESARSYLALPFAALTGTVEAAALDVPLDTDAADGSRSPETSAVQVCLVSGTVTAVQGSTQTPPAVSCATPVAAAYVATPTPHLHADLSPLAARLATATGLALLPDPTAAAGVAGWQVVFSAHDRIADTPVVPATVTLALAGPAPAAPTAPDRPAAPPPAPAAVTTLTGLGPVALRDADAPAAPPVDAAGAAPVAGPAATPAGTPEDAAADASDDGGETVVLTYPYAYPTVWLLPLAVLALVPLAYRALTKDLSGRRREEL